MRLIASLLAGLMGASYLKGKARRWWERQTGAAEEGRGQPPRPREEELKRDPMTGEFIPVSAALCRKIGGEYRYFVSVETYRSFRRRFENAAGGEGV
jgi:hypothetical protein